MNNEEQSLYQCIDACPAAVAVIDPKCSIQFANTGMLDFLGLALDEVVGSKCFQLVHGTQEAIQGYPLMTMVKNKARAEVEVDLAGRRYKVAAEPKDLHLAADAAYKNRISLPALNSIKELYGLADKQGLG